MTPSTVCIYRQCVINDLSARWLLKLTVIPCVKHAATLPWEISGRFPTNTAQQPDFLHYLVVAVYIYHPPLLERGIQNAVRVKYNKNIQQKHTHTCTHTNIHRQSHTHTQRHMVSPRHTGRHTQTCTQSHSKTEAWLSRPKSAEMTILSSQTRWRKFFMVRLGSDVEEFGTKPYS